MKIEFKKKSIPFRRNSRKDKRVENRLHKKTTTVIAERRRHN